jgi:hypothetical protein
VERTRLWLLVIALLVIGCYDVSPVSGQHPQEIPDARGDQTVEADAIADRAAEASPKGDAARDASSERADASSESDAAVANDGGADDRTMPDATADAVVADASGSDVVVDASRVDAVVTDAPGRDAVETPDAAAPDAQAGDASIDATVDVSPDQSEPEIDAMDASIGSSDASEGSDAPNASDASDADFDACVTCGLVSLQITPNPGTLSSKFGLQLHATGLYTGGGSRDLTHDVTWSADDAHVLAIGTTGDLTGFVVALDSGSTNVTAALGAITTSLSVEVPSNDIDSVELLPPQPFTLPVDTDVPLVATLVFMDGTAQDLTSLTTWSSSVPAVADVSATPSGGEVLTGASAGDTVISASILSFNLSTTATCVSLAVTGYTISVPTATLGLAGMEQLTASASFPDGSTPDVTARSSWSSSDTGVVRVNADGVARAVGVGTATITAMYESSTATTDITVSTATLDSLELTSPTATIALRSSVRWTATGVFSDASRLDVSRWATWFTNAIDAVNLTPDGVAQGFYVGGATVSAIFSGAGADATMTVRLAELSSIAVTAGGPVSASGAAAQFHATGHYADATTQDLTNDVKWVSSAPATASVSNAVGGRGMVTGLAGGTVTIEAQFGNVAGDLPVTVAP